MIDPTEIASLDRLMASLARKAAKDDPAAIAQLDQLAKRFTAYINVAGLDLHDGSAATATATAPAYSWSSIGAELGISPQGARKRFGRV